MDFPQFRLIIQHWKFIIKKNRWPFFVFLMEKKIYIASQTNTTCNVNLYTELSPKPPKFLQCLPKTKLS